MALKELRNSIDGTSLSADNFKAIWKKHIQEYWITPDNSPLNLKLDIVGDESLRADNDVTDHYVESNEAYQDQITLRPKVYTVNGEVGELVWYQREPTAQKLGQVAQKLEGVISFLPIRSKGFNQMKKTIMKASQWVDTASNAVTKLSSLVGGILNGETSPLTRQQQSYLYLLQLRDFREVLTIETPWGILKSYVITNLEFRQPKETKDKTYISITFKEFRTTSIRTVEFDEKKYQGNAALESQPKEDQGKTAGEDVSLPKETKTNDEGQIEQDCVATDAEGTSYEYIYNKELDPNNVDIIKTLPDGTSDVVQPNTPEYYRSYSLGWGQCEKSFRAQGMPEIGK